MSESLRPCHLLLALSNLIALNSWHCFYCSPPLVAESYGMEPASVVEIAADDSYGVLTDHNGIDWYHVKGNKENDECSNRGLVS